MYPDVVVCVLIGFVIVSIAALIRLLRASVVFYTHLSFVSKPTFRVCSNGTTNEPAYSGHFALHPCAARPGHVPDAPPQDVRRSGPGAAPLIVYASWRVPRSTSANSEVRNLLAKRRKRSAFAW